MLPGIVVAVLAAMSTISSTNRTAAPEANRRVSTTVGGSCSWRSPTRDSAGGVVTGLFRLRVLGGAVGQGLGVLAVEGRDELVRRPAGLLGRDALLDQPREHVVAEPGPLLTAHRGNSGLLRTSEQPPPQALRALLDGQVQHRAQ